MNPNNKAFIKKFKTKKHYYIYDVNSNEILQVDRITYDLIDYFGIIDLESINNKFKHKYNIHEIRNKYEIIKKEKKKNNYISNFRPGISFELKPMNEIKNFLSSNLEQLILELTEKCNQRCKYCAFSGRYYHKRTHGRKDMSYEVAKKAVDFFIKRSEGSLKENPSIGFYGGEPLLKFDLLKKIVEYIKNIESPKKYRISLTSNGTLISKEVIEYFVKNNIFITISLDGPENIHDRYRIFSSGEKTFKIIMKNLKRIEEYKSEYFENNITFNVVLAPSYDFESIITFFYRNPLFERIGDKFNFSFVDAYETTFFEDFNLKNYEKNKYKEIYKLRNKYKKALINGSYEDLNIESKLFDSVFYNIDYRGTDPLGERYAPQGTCFPGQRRLFVNANGKFFMCEKVGRNYEIGNVDDGFNLKRIYDFFEKYVEFFKDCKYCWALRLCKKCYNSIRKGENFDEKRKNKFCMNKLYNLEKDLIDYCEIREKNLNAFKVFENIKVW